jgi:hypothetical protein
LIEREEFYAAVFTGFLKQRAKEKPQAGQVFRRRFYFV